MSFSGEVNVGHIISIFAFLAAAIGLGLNFSQLRRNHKTQRTRFLKDLYSVLYSDNDIMDVFYEIEYGNFKYDKNFHGSDHEKKLDKLIYHLNLVCEFYLRKMITIEEMRYFNYHIVRISSSKEISNYLSFTEQLCSKSNLIPPFSSFRNYCNENLKQTERIG